MIENNQNLCNSKLQLLLFFAFILISSTALSQNLSEEEYQSLKIAGELEHANISSPYPSAHAAQLDFSLTRNNRDFCFIEHDPLTWTELPSNDDGSTGYIPLPFTFEMYGDTYNGLYVNNNGNITFDQPLGEYIPEGFPMMIPMIAPMWCDVDTRYTDDGEVWYFIGPNYFIASFVDVQVYVSGSYPWLRNTFQVVISDGTDDILAGSNNVGLFYGDMNWTTGDASGGFGGFGGAPATVGINKGDGVLFSQVGLFSQDNENHDGPFGEEDGVHYLDNLCLEFAAGTEVNTPPFTTNLPDSVNFCVGETLELTFQLQDEALEQTVDVSVDDNTNGGLSVLANSSGNPSSTTLEITGLTPGEYIYTINATDNGTPNASSSFDLVVVVEECCVPNLELSCSDISDLQCLPSLEPDIVGFPTFTVNDCWEEEVSMSYIDTFISEVNCQQSISREWTVSTGEEEQTCTQLITNYLDTTSPVFQQGNIFLEMPNGGAFYYIPFQNYTEQELNQALGLGFEDNCQLLFSNEDSFWSDAVSFLQNNFNPCSSQFSTTLSATDFCSNTTSVDITIEFFDFQSPNIITPNDLTVSCGNVPTFTLNDASAFDNSGAEPSLSISEELIPGVCPNSYSMVYTWTATDPCGNQSTAISTITVVDDLAPVFDSVFDDMELTCEEELPSPNAVTASDNCSTEVLVEWEEELTPGICPNNYSIVYTWTATDECGNQSTASSTITVMDTQGPVFNEVYDDVVIDCGDEIPSPLMLTATDNCTQDEILIELTEEIVPGDCPQNYSIIRTYRAFDACGNSSIFEHEILVQDTTAPILDDFEIEAELPCDDLDQILISATDNCGDVIITYEDTPFSGGCLGVLQRIYTVDDGCGNSISAEQFITVVDDVAPSFQDFPENMSISCEELALIDVPTLTAIDNCDDDVEVVFLGQEMTGDSCSQILNYSWQATDHCDNVHQQTWTLEVSDFTAPIFTNFPPDLVLECGSEVPEIVLPEAEDNCDTDVEIWVTVLEVPGVECEEQNNLQRIFRGFDNCGNQVMAVQNVSFVADPIIEDEVQDEDLDTVELFPNPATDIVKLTFQAEQLMNYKGSIQSLDGKVMKSFFDGRLSEGKHTLKFDVSTLETGMYYIELRSEKSVYRTRIIVL